MNVIIKLFLTFAKIGLVGFGGGLAILPLIFQGMKAFGSITPEEFAELFAISQATPGPIAVNAATFAGFETAGIPGALAATLGVAFPAFILVGLSVKFLNKYQEHKLIKGAFVGIRPVSVGMIMAGFIMVGQTTLFDGTHLLVIPTCLTILTFILADKFKVSAIKLIIIMGIAGAFLC
ncbi:MAG: chromate transporter [Firmicutes bacterium]|nr:chromate transporter [Bacillota bacterium]